MKWIKKFFLRILQFICYFLLFVLAWFLILPFTCINLLCVLWKNGNVEGYFINSAISLDKWGCREWRTGLNMLMLKKKSLHPFGNVNETMSSVFGKNKIKGTLRFFFGKIIAGFLNFIDKNHCEKSIKSDVISGYVPFVIKPNRKPQYKNLKYK